MRTTSSVGHTLASTRCPPRVVASARPRTTWAWTSRLSLVIGHVPDERQDLDLLRRLAELEAEVAQRRAEAERAQAERAGAEAEATAISAALDDELLAAVLDQVRARSSP